MPIMLYRTCGILFIWGFICRWADAADILLSRGGMGAGDVKLSFVLGVWLGFKASIVCLMLAFVLGDNRGAAAGFRYQAA